MPERHIWKNHEGAIIIGAHQVEPQYPQFGFDDLGNPVRTEFRRIAITAMDSEAISDYEQVKDDFIKILEPDFAQHTGSITLLRVQLSGLVPTSHQAIEPIPTVFIIHNQPARVANDISRVKTNLRIELRRGWVDFIPQIQPAAASIPPRDGFFYECVNLGASIGVSDVKIGTGSLGGYVTDKNTGEVYGVTNGHVCLSHLSGTIKELPMILSPADNVSIVQPSDEDHAHALLSAEYEVQSAIEVNDIYGGMRPAAARNLERSLEQQKQVMTRDRYFGRVEAAYYGVEGSSWRDFALIRPLQDRVGRTAFRPIGVEGYQAVRGHCSLVSDGELWFPGGRSTNASPAMLNKELSDVWIRSSLLTPARIIKTREFTAVGGAARELINPGDSGSFLLQSDADGRPVKRVAGLLFAAGFLAQEGGEERGETRAGYAEVAYFMPVSTLLDLWKDLGFDFEFGEL